MFSTILGLILAAAQEPPNRAHVRLYPDASGFRGEIARLEGQQRWADAARRLVAAVSENAGALIPLPDDETRYSSVAEFAGRRIAAWPDEGLAAARAMIDPMLARAIDAARARHDRAELERLARTWPFSSRAAEALLVAASLAWDDGDLDGAAAALERWADPAGDAPVDAYGWARLAEAYARAGRAEDLAALRSLDLPDAQILVAGHAVALRDYVAGLTADRDAVDDPAFAVPDAAARAAAGPADVPPVQWDTGLPIPRYVSISGLYGMDQPRLDETSTAWPAVAGGVVYSATDFSVHAHRLHDGGAAELWQFRQPPLGIPYEPLAVHSVTIHGGGVYAALVTATRPGVQDAGNIWFSYPLARRAIFRLDPVTGSEVWRVGGGPAGADLPEGYSFCAAPTPAGDVLYAVASLQEGPDTFRQFLVALRASDGEVLWSTFIASGGTETNLFGNSLREPMAAPVVVDGDLAIVCTNLGALAAVDRFTGHTRWLLRYPQAPISPTRHIYATPSAPLWANRAPIVDGNRIVVTPTDATDLLVVERGTGAITTRIGRDGSIGYLFGVADGIVYVGGRTVRAYRIDDGRRVREYPVAALGCGAVADGRLYVPHRGGLTIFDIGNPTRALSQRPINSWRGAQNLTVVRHAIVGASSQHVGALVDREGVAALVARAREGAANMPLAELAEAAAASRVETDTERLLRAVVERDPYGRRGAAAAAQLASLYLQQAGRLRESRRWEDCLAALARAAEWLPPGERRRIDLERARALMGAARFEEALAILQERVADEDDVRDKARQAITEAIAVFGEAVYAPYEERAQRLLRDLPPERLGRILWEYPNSRAAREAVRRMIALEREAGRLASALDRVREFLREFPGDGAVAAECVSLAQAMEAAGMTRAAESLLRSMVTDLSGAPLEDGTAGDWARRRLTDERYSRAAARPPALEPPFERVARVRLRGAAGVTLEPEGRPAPGQPALAFLLAESTVRALRLDDGEIAWTARVEAPVVWSALADDRLVLGRDSGVTALGLADGRPLWEIAGGSWDEFALAGSILVAHRSDSSDPGNDLVAIDLFAGTFAWRHPIPIGGRPVIEVSPPQWVVALTVPENEIFILDAMSGRLAFSSRMTAANESRLMPGREGGVVTAIAGRGLRWIDLPPDENPLDGPRCDWMARDRDGLSLMTVAEGRVLEVTPNGRDVRFAAVDLASARLVGDQPVAAPDGVYSVDGDASIAALGLGQPSAFGGFTVVSLPRGAAVFTYRAAENEEAIGAPRVIDGFVTLLTATGATRDRIPWRWRVWNSGGEVVLDVFPEEPAEGLPALGVVEGRMVLSIEDEVEIWR